MTIDTKKLRELAGKATPGPWVTANGKGSAVVRTEHPEYDCAIYLNVRTVEHDVCVQRWQDDARFIAGASPDAVLSLLNEIELLAAREPTRAEMERYLGDRDEIPQGEPYPPGWPTIRRCRHCRAPVPGGPTACVLCADVSEVRADAVFALAMDQEQIEALEAQRDRLLDDVTELAARCVELRMARDSLAELAYEYARHLPLISEDMQAEFKRIEGFAQVVSKDRG